MKKINKILIIIQRANGDVLLSHSLITSLFKNFNQPQIDLLVNDDTIAIAKLLPNINFIHTFSYKDKREKHWRQEKKIIQKIFRQYDLSINLTASDRSVIYSILAGKKSISAIEKKPQKSWWKKIFLTYFYYFDTDKHILLNNIEPLNLLNINQELNKFEPEILTSCKKSLSNEFKDLEFIRIDKKEFCKSPNQSIDYAVMEKTNKAKVVPLDAGWSDVGSWDALMDSKIKDSLGNVVEGDVTLDQVKNSYLYSTNRLVAASNIADLIVIDTQDALLVTTRDNSLSIKNIVKKLKKDKRTEIENHRKVYKPWGYYDSIDTGYNFQVKRILVNPGAKLSLQKHLHRSEHWVVVSGVAKITCGKKIYNLEKNQSTYIPKGEIHRLENIENYPLEIIEVQTGNYLGEDDIIRLKDDYQRN
ncbi:mannose-1-phosphate guanylyltransferase/mannose-6-phosphate isomerase [Candidatus Pseudothioglobus singularis]|nr:mannose-1-phosphate guanylyltransferase/mannose-6-phosphate isomerase [Candidatus Pseudothioglobus singularis]